MSTRLIQREADNMIKCLLLLQAAARQTPFRTTSWLSLHFINRTIFQLVLQLTELTWKTNNQEFAVAVGTLSLHQKSKTLKWWLEFVAFSLQHDAKGRGTPWNDRWDGENFGWYRDVLTALLPVINKEYITLSISNKNTQLSQNRP